MKKKTLVVMLFLMISIISTLSGCDNDTADTTEGTSEADQIRNVQEESSIENEIEPENETQSKVTNVNREMIGIVMSMSQDGGIHRIGLIELNINAEAGGVGFYGRLDVPESEWIYLYLDEGTVIEIEEGDVTGSTLRSGAITDILERDLLRIDLLESDSEGNNEFSFETITIMRSGGVVMP